MKWKMFEAEGKLASAKEKMFEAFRLIIGLGKESSNVSSPTLAFKVASYVPANVLARAYLEAALTKEEALVYWNRSIRTRVI